MIGLPGNVNWAEFTRQNRKLDEKMKYSDFNNAWQLEIDKGIATHNRVYLQLPRGHDKTERYAWWSLLWLCTTKSNKGYCCGVDRDNARLFRDASKKLVALHPELFADIIVEKHIVHHRTTGSWIETISSDANSAYGLNFELLIINDFHAWPDKTFWDVLWTACGKKPNVRVWIESNALTMGTDGFQWVSAMRDWVKNEGVKRTVPIRRPNGNWSETPEWYFYCPNGFLATWQSRELDVWKRTLHPSVYRRLINNEDCSDEQSFVTVDQVQACEILKGPSNEWTGKEGPAVTTLDLGLKKDATSIATVSLTYPAKPGGLPQLRLLALDVVTGDVENPVTYNSVESLLLHHKTAYNSVDVLADPWNTQALIQKYGWLKEWTFTTKHIAELTQLLYQAIANKQLQLYPSAGFAQQRGGWAMEEWDLKRELTQAVVKPMSYGSRVDHRAGGYTDRLMAVGMAVHHLLTEYGAPSAPKPKAALPLLYEISGAKLIKDWCDPPVQGKALRL